MITRSSICYNSTIKNTFDGCLNIRQLGSITKDGNKSILIFRLSATREIIIVDEVDVSVSCELLI